MTAINIEQQVKYDGVVIEEDIIQNQYDGVVTFLVSLGLLASWCAVVVVAMAVGVDTKDIFSRPQSKPMLYYLLHAAGIFSIVGAGAIAAIDGQYGKLNRTARAAFWVLQAASIVWAFVAYGLKDYWEVFGATGPIVWLSCILIFAGMNKSIWIKLDRVIIFISYVTAALALYIVAKYKVIDARSDSGAVMLMVILAWFAGWTLLTSGKVRGWRFWLRCFPYVAFVVTTIFTQTRSWLLVSMLLLVAYFFVMAPSRLEDEQVRFVRSKVFFSIVLTVLVAALLFQDEIVRSFGMLQSRLYDDTRTGQYEEFFSQVPLSDLVLGRGPKGTWLFGGEEYQFFDNAYVWMAFIGGLPILLSYIILIILPGIRAIFRGAKGNDAAASALLILWGISCFGVSTYCNPSLNSYSYLICLLAGRCYGCMADTDSDEEAND